MAHLISEELPSGYPIFVHPLIHSFSPHCARTMAGTGEGVPRNILVSQAAKTWLQSWSELTVLWSVVFRILSVEVSCDQGQGWGP